METCNKRKTTFVVLSFIVHVVLLRRRRRRRWLDGDLYLTPTCFSFVDETSKMSMVSMVPVWLTHKISDQIFDFVE